MLLCRHNNQSTLGAARGPDAFRTHSPQRHHSDTADFGCRAHGLTGADLFSPSLLLVVFVIAWAARPSGYAWPVALQFCVYVKMLMPSTYPRPVNFLYSFPMSSLATSVMTVCGQMRRKWAVVPAN